MLRKLWRSLKCETAEMHLPSFDGDPMLGANCRSCGRVIRQGRDGMWYCSHTRAALEITQVVLVTAGILIATSATCFLALVR